MKSILAGSAVTVLCLAAVALGALAVCQAGHRHRIAVIPRTSGTILWEPENVGAQKAAQELGEEIYWNATGREDDIDGQIALVDRVVSGNYKGLVLAPNHVLALITPIRRALAKGMPTVIVGSPLPIPADGNLSYVLNDEQEGGRLAAERVARLVRGTGNIALTGINPDIAAIMQRAQSFEQALAVYAPGVRVVVRRMGTFNVAHEQEEADDLLRENPHIDAMVTLTAASTRAAISVIEGTRPSSSTKVVGFDPEALPFESKSLDSMIVQNTRGMGDQAIRIVHARSEGDPVPRRVLFKPLLVTRENFGSTTAMLLERWQPGGSTLRWAENP